MPEFDLLIRGGTLVDGSGSPSRAADVAVRGDRIEAIGQLDAVPEGSIGQVVQATGRVVCPGFIDIHGHSDGSVLVDGALLSHLAQGITTQVSGNCGESLAPLTPRGRERANLALRDLGDAVRLDWTDFEGYLARVADAELGPNVGFLVGHGTVRASVLGSSDRAPDEGEQAALVRAVEAALDAGALGLSTGLIYAPGMHASYPELASVVAPVARRGALYATHVRNEAAGLFEALAEAVAVAWGEGTPARLEVSHLKAGAQVVWGEGPAALHFLEEARRLGLDAAADQYPYTSAATTLATILPPELLGREVDATVAALRDRAVRERLRDDIATRHDGWENVAGDPGWAAIRLTDAAGHREWQGRTFVELGEQQGRDPLEVACDLLVDERLDVGIALECMAEEDVEAILQAPWVAVCTDAAAVRPDHPRLGQGRPHPRAYGTFPRVLGRYVRERRVLPLERAVAKMTAVPAERLQLRRRGQVREGWAADLVVFDPATVTDRATDADPHRLPAGIEAVVVNGTIALEDGRETGARPGRLLHRGD